MLVRSFFQLFFCFTNIDIVAFITIKLIYNIRLKHCQELNHSFNFDDPKILIQNSNVRPRKFLESFFTSGNSNSLNRCINFSEIYSPIITEIASKYSNWSAIRSILVYLSFSKKKMYFFFSHSSNWVYSFSILMLFWNYVLIFFFSLILF